MTELGNGDFDFDKFYDNIKNELNLYDVDMPKDVIIYTITMEAKLDTTFYPMNIYNYIKRSSNGIVNATKDKDKKKTTNKNDVNRFLNQVTLYVKVSNKENPVSVKVFNNGKLHFTGCLNIDNMLEASDKIFKECLKKRAVFNKELNKMEEIKFVSNKSDIKLEKLKKFEIDLVNCGFEVPFKINLGKLKTLMKLNDYDVEYDTINHPGLRIKYLMPKQYYIDNYINKENNKLKPEYTDLSNKIVVYNTGKISISIGKNKGLQPIKPSYEFIYSFLLENYDKIVNDDIETKSSIEEFLLDNYDNSNLISKKTVHEFFRKTN